MRRPWAARYRRRCYETLTHGYGVRFKDEEHAFKFSSLFAAFVAIHIVGGLLCVPSLLVGQSSLTTALAAQGALIEIGWEASDLAVRVWQLCGFAGQAGRDINPPMLVFFAVCHHTMGTSMILPMNVYFRDSRDYHELVFLLQFGAFVAMFSQAYGYTLDVSTRGGLVRMRRAALWTFVSVLWSRGIRYVVIGARLLDAIRRAGHERMYTGGVAGLLGMMIFNAVVIADCARRLWKFGVRTPMPPLQNPSRDASGGRPHHDDDYIIAFMRFSKEMRPYVERDEDCDDPRLRHCRVDARLGELWRSLTDTEQALYYGPRRR